MMACYIGMGAILIGCFFLAVGLPSGVKGNVWSEVFAVALQSGVKGNVMRQGLILIISGVFIIIFGDLREPGMVMFGFLVIALFVAILISLNKENAKKRADIIGATMLDRFFVECVLADANDFTKEKNSQRAQLLADKYGLKYPNGIEALYKQGLEEHEAVSQRFVLNKLEVKRAEEREKFDQLNKYSDLVGKDKRIAMLTDRAAELRNKAKGQAQYADMLMRSGQQKEQDWATWGGVASGIAGFGAGVATAIDIQQQNIQIRAENEKRRQAALPGYMFMFDSASDNRRNADAIMEEIENFKMKLISDVSSQELFKKISFANTDVLVSETGSAMVCTVASLKPNYTIFDDVPAIIDGTIIAKIYDGDELCGTAQLVLPVYGLGKDIPLNGICIDCCKPGKTYTAKFSPKNLWALEK